MKKTMMIVDDGTMNRAILKDLFCQEFNIVEASNGEEALQMLEMNHNSVDIVLLDLIMPGITGIDVLKRRKEIDYFRRIPVIVITGSENVDDHIAAFELGADDFVTKPFVAQIVSTRVKNVLAYKHQLNMAEKEAKQFRMKSELDEMTGLVNKATTELAISEILENQEEALHAFMFIDIDNFKTVNDTMGHPEGDRVIKTIALLLNSQFRKTDVIGRVGGDEFCVLMKDVPSKTIVYQKINELIQLMRFKPGIAIPEYVTLSIGMATNERIGTNYKELSQKADEALYQAKRGGKARFREYGVEAANVETDKRHLVVFVSENRGVSSLARAVIPSSLRVIEMSKVEQLAEVSEQDASQIELIFVDVMEHKGDTTEIWKRLKAYPWVSMEHVFAICKDGCKNQYFEALNNGVADLFIEPLGVESLKTRVERIMERLKIIEK